MVFKNHFLLNLLVISVIIFTYQISGSLGGGAESHLRSGGDLIFSSDIVITSDEDWVLQGWPGDGTINWPYTINGMNERNIKISGTSKWFVIQNTTVYSIQLDNLTNGRVEDSEIIDLQALRSANLSIINNVGEAGNILLSACTEIFVFNNSFSLLTDSYYKSIGILVIDSRNVRISNNTVRSKYTGIVVMNTIDCILDSNYITECGFSYTITATTVTVNPNDNILSTASQAPNEIIEGKAIDILNCSRTSIYKNHIIQNPGYSVSVNNSSSTAIYDNDISMNNGGMSIKGCIVFNLTRNIVSYGVSIESSTSGIVEENRFDSSGLSLQGNLTCLLHSISNNTADGFPIIYLANVNSSILDFNTLYQFIMVNCTDVNLYNTVIIGTSGIEIVHSQSCHFYGITGYRFTVRDSYDVILQYSNMNYAYGYGITIDSSNVIQIMNNSLICGILVINHSYIVTISGNVQRSIRASAIRVESGSSNVFIEYNDIQDCGIVQSAFYYPIYYPAIDIQGTDCFICGNIIVNNWGRGITVYGENVSVFYNTIARNRGGNALDNGINNIWDDNVSRGNLWGDYIGFGIYYILGTAGSIDRYPTLNFELIEQSVLLAWGLMIGLPVLIVLSLGIMFFAHKWRKSKVHLPRERVRIGLG